jgi:hypothetical protein
VGVQASTHLGEEGDGGDLEKRAQAEWTAHKIAGSSHGGRDAFGCAEWSHKWVR